MKCLILTYDYYPYKTPNSNCLEMIIKELKQEYQIDILTSRKSETDLNFEEYDGVKVHRINDWYFMSSEEILMEKGYIKNLINIPKRLFNKFCRYFLRPDISFGWKEKAIEKSQIMQSQNNYDLIFSISLPFSSHIIAYELKKKYPNLFWITYDLDPYSDNRTYLGMRYYIYRHFNKKIENNIRKTADITAMTPELLTFYKSNKHITLNKTVEMPLPLISDINKINVTNLNNESINIVYTGMLYKDIRNPTYLLKIMEKILIKQNIHLHFYGSENDCKEILKVYKKRHNDNIHLHGLVSKKQANEAISNADFLINIGNSVTHQVPSKIFEYISTGKPIINLYRINEDTSKKYIDLYGNGINIHEDISDMDNNIKKIINFLTTNLGKTISNSKINEVFYDNTPQGSAEALKDIINKMIGQKK